MLRLSEVFPTFSTFFGKKLGFGHVGHVGHKVGVWAIAGISAMARTRLRAEERKMMC